MVAVVVGVVGCVMFRSIDQLLCEDDREDEESIEKKKAIVAN